MSSIPMNFQRDAANTISMIRSLPASLNLVRSGVRSRLMDAGRAWFCGDSLSANEVTAARFLPAAQRTWNANWAGVYVARSRSANGVVDGMVSLHSTIANTAHSSVDPELAGSYDLSPLIPQARRERVWSANGAANEEMSNPSGLRSDIIFTGGVWQWANPNWMFGKTMKCAGIMVQHPLGGTGNIRGKLAGNLIGSRIPFDTEGTKAIIRTDEALIGTPEITTGTVAMYIEAASVVSGDGIVELYTHIWSDEDDDTGVHLGAIAQSGLRADQWIDATHYSQTHMAEFIEVTKADTFILYFGANDSAVADPVTFKTRVEAVITAMKAASATAIVQDATIRPAKFLLLGVYQVQNRQHLFDSYPKSLVEITLGSVADTAFISLPVLTGYRGTTALAAAGFTNDNTHPSSSGALYFMQLVWDEIARART